ncbi:LysR substrate-binding domain-containing protein [Labrys monachus]|uniref:DNA-binding transcriptional LysR family regulator n=1 Tax=Labrys monachus TaxID=217067 RepID=A0ABU0FKS1_9HYPH|nr:LysR substrate-binding domain-containing protein [Labrys monachus]MDQ0395121.1 DNA-binding transcriptional LysR family regulator [Labrys monachus]
MRRVILDLDVLASFVAGVELGSFARAAERLGRSTSAVSAQLKKLEDQAGTAILRKSGRGLALTEAGETMLAHARRLLELNDEAVAAVRGIDLEGTVRFGVQEDLGETVLPAILGRFARAHPKVRIEARVARNAELLDRIAAGQLDLAIAWGDGSRDDAASLAGEALAEMPMRWIGPAGEGAVFAFPPGDPLPLVMFEAPCLFRTAATEALDRAGIAWRIAFTGASLTGLWAAVAAGLGITLRTAIGLPAGLAPIEPGGALPAGFRSLPLRLYRGHAARDPVVERLADIMRDSLRELPPSRTAA